MESFGKSNIVEKINNVNRYLYLFNNLEIYFRKKISSQAGFSSKMKHEQILLCMHQLAKCHLTISRLNLSTLSALNNLSVMIHDSVICLLLLYLLTFIYKHLPIVPQRVKSICARRALRFYFYPVMFTNMTSNMTFFDFCF